MEIFYNTEVGRFELYRVILAELFKGKREYLVYWKMGQEWRTECLYVSQEVLEDALAMGVLRPATADEVRTLDLDTF